MKKLIGLLVFTSIITTTGLTQEDVRKSFTSINLGVSFPSGNFKSTNFDNIEAGYANIGSIFDITFGYKFHPSLSVATLLRGQVNTFNAGDYAQGMADFLGAGYPAGSTSVSVYSSNYSMGGIMAGIIGSFPVVDKVSFDPRVLIGYSTNRLPSMTQYAYAYDKLLLTTVQEDAETISFSYLIGAGAKVALNHKTCLLFNIDFYSAKAKWNDVQYIYLQNVTRDFNIRYYDIEQVFSTVNISMGVYYKI
jgi:hypothetical protein